MDLAPVVARIRAQAPSLKGVAGAASLARAQQNFRNSPYAWVVPARERAGENILDVGVHQRVTVDFSVVLVVTNASDSAGASAHTDLEPVRDEVRGALLAWTPAGADEPVEYAGGELVGFNAHVLWWREQYRTRLFIRQV